MMSSQEYARELEKFSAAIGRIPELETLLAKEQGARSETEAALARSESRCETLQTERDAAVARVVEAETQMRIIAAQILAAVKPNQPHRNEAVEKLITDAVSKAAAEPASAPIETAGAKPAKIEKIAA